MDMLRQAMNKEKLEETRDFPIEELKGVLDARVELETIPNLRLVIADLSSYFSQAYESFDYDQI